jgi:GTP cyclohydrolase I
MVVDKRPTKKHINLESFNNEVNFVHNVTVRKDEQNIQKLTEACATILECLGEDLHREGLLKTPKRMAESLLFLTHGVEKTIMEVVNDAIFCTDTDDMVIVKDIEIFSLCEHHMLPFFGKAHVGYIPNGKILGLSKIARIIEIYSRRLQVQERLTRCVVDALMEAINPSGCCVVIECRHMCMSMRGVQSTCASTTTSAVAGVFRDDEKTRKEFMSLIGHSRSI